MSADVKRAWIIFAAVLVLTLLAEFLMHPHSSFGIDGTLFFHAWYGFAACVAIVLISKLLGYVLKRPEDYYGESYHDE
jgi:uncharacterized membrane protein AbrB (regulator of aidB expression)